ncbi:16S rRNA (guanine(966)-N(2))-methyltransferase RsmD [Desulfovibrio sp. OttesenSCG-928-M16]|nr:16S rRNA (guanine(966)-N(2))-methyltransferase RsmD [Desulfovibrio sp. OttesenSCG-928-M16]
MRIIAGTYKGRALKSTTGPGFRPAMGKVREALFSMLEARGICWPEARVLDLFAGSGSLGFEALSRGAAHVCFVESAAYAVKVIAANAELLGIEPGRVAIRREETAKALAMRPADFFDVVFIDPPYQLPVLGPTLQALNKNGWLAKSCLVNAEVEARQAFDPEKAHPALELLADRAYGQTRVILWRKREEHGT